MSMGTNVENVLGWQGLASGQDDMQHLSLQGEARGQQDRAAGRAAPAAGSTH